jgi:hypothetical protein
VPQFPTGGRSRDAVVGYKEGGGPVVARHGGWRSRIMGIKDVWNG